MPEDSLDGCDRAADLRDHAVCRWASADQPSARRCSMHGLVICYWNKASCEA
jgi:hypothetical protein